MILLAVGVADNTATTRKNVSSMSRIVLLPKTIRSNPIDGIITNLPKATLRARRVETARRAPLASALPSTIILIGTAAAPSFTIPSKNHSKGESPSRSTKSTKRDRIGSINATTTKPNNAAITGGGKTRLITVQRTSLFLLGSGKPSGTGAVSGKILSLDMFKHSPDGIRRKLPAIRAVLAIVST
eukprot:CAMPEP_0169252202 /NCGR_PEP_ID=MMETSP1016-20121227/37926_1 /TAXON_ID=342587 /ORGANISM="Karlodinium micrum, Strain CCMP2283" /LENGTH=184 /DNA_ID=CAMNT_0009333401 /DNA_START=148 /DNA_END=702 /DNA_ORIENTATION=-